MIHAFAAGLLAASAPTAITQEPLRYEVDLTGFEDDLFHVVAYPAELTAEDRYFDFVAFAPGVHSVLNFGRFVQELKAFDDAGNELGVEKLDMNRWELAEPTKVARIAYTIEDSFDTEIQEHRVLPCAGTGIEDDYVLMNNYGVLGYFENHLARPVELTVAHDPDWVVGTALTPSNDGVYRASSYRHLADSPFLMGDLTTTGIWVGDIEVEIFSHSKVPGLSAEEVLFVAGDALVAAERFIGFAPVERYAFLFAFLDRESMMRNQFRSMGALEHSYSSMYSLPAAPEGLDALQQTISHEFMHILTPLHLKSTIIADFDYSIPTTDRHLWLYEGLTEWSSDMVRLRGEITDLEQHLGILSRKIATTRQYDPEYSLARLSAEWSTPAGLRQYGNIYQLGALTSAVLDIRLLELSGGERGLREVFFEFIKKRGKDNPFDDETFFDEFVAATYPEIEEFIQAYILDGEPLPYAEAFAKVGVAFDGTRLSIDASAPAEAIALREVWSGSLTGD